MKNCFLIVLILCCIRGKSQCDGGTAFDYIYSQTPKGYAADANMYHILRNDKVAREKYYNDWYNKMTATTNLGELENVFETLLNGNYEAARKMLKSITVANKVEEKIISFYRLYANYFQTVKESTTYAPNDSLKLLNMAHLCLNEYGASIYRARELYKNLYKTVVKYEDCKCLETDTRFVASNTQTPN
ncbi:MAG: hypothetical protein KF900_02950 [Bacteroidetes bacterium]|nr:hypothetical protein [Bacteroidota bacterium]